VKLADSIGLTSIHCAVMRFPALGRGLAFVAVLSMLLALTPCCEANAAPPPAGGAPAGHVHPPGADEGGHAHDHGAPATPDPCPVWLDNLFHALGAATGAANSEFEACPLPPALAVLLMPPTAPAALSSPRRSVHSPPFQTLPLYLRVKHLLI
jgi:hypothetical protein